MNFEKILQDFVEDEVNGDNNFKRIRSLDLRDCKTEKDKIKLLINILEDVEEILEEPGVELKLNGVPIRKEEATFIKEILKELLNLPEIKVKEMLETIQKELEENFNIKEEEIKEKTKEKIKEDSKSINKDKVSFISSKKYDKVYDFQEAFSIFNKEDCALYIPKKNKFIVKEKNGIEEKIIDWVTKEELIIDKDLLISDFKILEFNNKEKEDKSSFKEVNYEELIRGFVLAKIQKAYYLKDKEYIEVEGIYDFSKITVGDLLSYRWFVQK